MIEHPEESKILRNYAIIALMSNNYRSLSESLCFGSGLVSVARIIPPNIFPAMSVSLARFLGSRCR